MKKIAFTMLALSFLTFLGNAQARELAKIVAVVNDQAITDADVKKASASVQKRATQDPAGALTEREVLERIIDQKLLDDILTKSKIEVTEDELARAIAGVLNENKISIDALKAELTQKGVSYEDYKKDISRQVKKMKFMNQVIGPQIKIAEQDLRDYYQRNQEQFRGSHSAHIAQIVLPLDGIQTQAEFEALRDTAIAISSKAKKGANFAELAAKNSKGPAAVQGGDIGMVDLKNISPAVADAVRTLQIGQVSQPILDKNAVVIVKLIALPEISAKDFEKMRDNIYSALYDEKIEETLKNYLTKERQKAFIEIR